MTASPELDFKFWARLTASKLGIPIEQVTKEQERATRHAVRCAPMGGHALKASAQP